MKGMILMLTGTRLMESGHLGDAAPRGPFAFQCNCYFEQNQAQTEVSVDQCYRKLLTAYLFKRTFTSFQFYSLLFFKKAHMAKNISYNHIGFILYLELE